MEDLKKDNSVSGIAEAQNTTVYTCYTAYNKTYEWQKFQS